MTILEKILEIELINNRRKLNALVEMDAPKEMIRTVTNLINNVEQNIYMIDDKDKLKGKEFQSVEEVKMNGKTHYVFNDTIVFYPTSSTKAKLALM